MYTKHIFLSYSTAARRSAKTTPRPPIKVDTFQFPLAAAIAIPLAFTILCIVAIIWCVVQTMKHRKQFNASAATLQPATNGISTLNNSEKCKNGQVIYQPRPEMENKLEVTQFCATLPDKAQRKVTQFHAMNGLQMRYGPQPEVTQHELSNQPRVTQREHHSKPEVTQRKIEKDEIPEIRIIDTEIYPMRNVYTENPLSSSLTNSNNNIRTSHDNASENSSPTLPQEDQLHKEAYSDCSHAVNDGNFTDFDYTTSHIDDYGIRNSEV